MTAIDMNTGEHVWMTPLGNGDRIRNHPMLKALNLPPVGGDGRGGPLLTKTILITALSAGGSDDGPRLVAYNKATGEELSSVDLPTGAIGSPMTYMINNKQHIAVTVGGNPPELISFALPDDNRLTQASTGTGLYTNAQATRGKNVFAASCVACHAESEDASASHDAAPSLIGEAFLARWGELPLADLFTTIRQTMPVAAPNSLSGEDYEAVTSYILKLNGFPAGSRIFDRENRTKLGEYLN